MRVKSTKDELESYLTKKIGYKENLKEKAMRKNRELLNPIALMERMEKRNQATTSIGLDQNYPTESQSPK